MKFQLCSFLLVLGSACVDAPTSSVEAASSTRDHRHRRPPREAVEACKDSTVDAACAFTIDGHDVTGTCRAAPEGIDGPLACAPDRPPPPPESLAACDGAAAGDACDFAIDGRAFDGTCKSPDDASPLGCAPENPPPLPPR